MILKRMPRNSRVDEMNDLNHLKFSSPRSNTCNSLDDDADAHDDRFKMKRSQPICNYNQ